MIKAYRKADNCGPVPYPDGSGKMLTDGVVSGESWEPLEALGYVIPHSEAVDSTPTPELPKEPEPEPVVEGDGVKLADGGGVMKDQQEQPGTKAANVAGEGTPGDKRGGRGGKRGGGSALNG